MAEETKYDLTEAGPTVVERFDEATARDEKDGDNICILHGLEKAMIGTTTTMRVVEHEPTLEAVKKWLAENDYTEKCLEQCKALTGSDELTVSFVRAWANKDPDIAALYHYEFSEEIPCTVAVYERSLCIECIADGFDDESIKETHSGEFTEEEMNNPFLLRRIKLQDAEEFFEYNTVRTLPHIHEAAPIIVDGFAIDIENNRWNAFKKTDAEH